LHELEDAGTGVGAIVGAGVGVGSPTGTDVSVGAGVGVGGKVIDLGLVRRVCSEPSAFMI